MKKASAISQIERQRQKDKRSNTGHIEVQPTFTREMATTMITE